MEDASIPDGVIFAERRCWTCVAADHEDENGETIIDGDKIGEREEELALYFATAEQANSCSPSMGEGWDEVSVAACASLRFGNVYVVRCRRVVEGWFAPQQWDSRQPEHGWHALEVR